MSRRTRPQIASCAMRWRDFSLSATGCCECRGGVVDLCRNRRLNWPQSSMVYWEVVFFAKSGESGDWRSRTKRSRSERGTATSFALG